MPLAHQFKTNSKVLQSTLILVFQTFRLFLPSLILLSFAELNLMSIFALFILFFQTLFIKTYWQILTRSFEIEHYFRH